jgi:hypothetical protein
MTDATTSRDNAKLHCACTGGDLAGNVNRQFHLVRIPVGPLTRDCFSLAVAAIPGPKEGEVLLKTRYLSVDAANRAWMQGATYRDALGAGTVMAARGVGEVIESRHPDFKTGDLAFGDCGWQEYAAVPGQSLMKQPHLEPRRADRPLARQEPRQADDQAELMDISGGRSRSHLGIPLPPAG